MVSDIGARIEWSPDLPSEVEEEVLWGTVTVFGTHHHVCAIAVTRNAQGAQVAVKDPFGRLADLYGLAEPAGPFAETTLPGYPGRWVVAMFPHGV
jgi:hypothetical protein